MQRFERLRPYSLARPPGPHWLAGSFEVHCAQMCDLEEIADQPSRALRNNNLVWLGAGLQTQRNIRRLTDNAALPRAARIEDVTEHDQASRDANLYLQQGSCLYARDRFDQLKSRPHRPFSVILLGLGIAEIDKNPVA